MKDDYTRSGRRPGPTTTRTTILSVARSRFAESGFDSTSVRSIARDAGVDPALVHHYFGSKKELFVAAVELPVQPSEILDPVLAGPTAEMGATLLRGVLGVWDSENGEQLLASFRSMIAGHDESLLRSFLMGVVLRDITPRVDEPSGTGPLRINLVASQMAGVLLARYLLVLEPLASMTAADVVAYIGPTLQNYLTGELPG